MSSPILVTGATGNVGVEVLTLLLQRNTPVRAAVRAPDSFKQKYPQAEAVRFDFRDATTYSAAFSGVKRVYLVRPPDISDIKRDMAPALRAMREAGVEHIVFLSLLGAEQSSFMPHRKIEKEIEALEFAHTFLRASFFFQNLSTTHAPDIRDHADLPVPAGKGRTSFIDVRDIAAVAVEALTTTGHANKAYDLTGCEALAYEEVAEALSAELGKTVSYKGNALPLFVKRMRSRGFPWPFIAVTIAIYSVARFGLAARLAPDTAAILGRQPIALREFVRDYADVWR